MPEISIPFTLDANGVIAKSQTDDDRVRLHFMSLINTSPGERTVYSNYGVPLSDMLFETGGDHVKKIILQDIADAAAHWEPGIRVGQGIDVPTDNSDSLVMLNLTYSRVDSQVDSGHTAAHSNTVIIGPGGVRSQQVRG